MPHMFKKICHVFYGIEYSTFFSLVYGFINALVFIYDAFTYPIYLVIQNPIKTLKTSKMKKAIIVDQGEDYITYKTVKKPFPPHVELEQLNITTMAELFDNSAKKYTNKECLGTREILGEEDEVQPNGRVFKKYKMGEYKWLSYAEVDRLATNFGKGLRGMGSVEHYPIAILAETQAKWMVAAHGVFKNNIPLVTIYATLGDEAIAHAINETEVQTVITSYTLLPKFKKILANTSTVRTIVYMEDQLEVLQSKDGYKEDVDIKSFNEIIELGARSSIVETRPTHKDIAIIMYTSGSTGVPKGVKLLHLNLIASLKAFMDCTSMREEEVVLGYLPLAHVLELLVENGLLFMGKKIGYSSALTMLDNGSKIKRGTKGDVSVLKPTFTCSVPLILDRISKAITDKVNESGEFKKALFKWGYNYKTKWYKRGFSTPLTDRIIFKATKNIMGGRLYHMAAGGAPLTLETQEMINTCLCMRVLQGYGLTETGACACNQDTPDLILGRVGPPMSTALLRITNWEEGNYFITDKPYPRGEIVIGGDIVSPGYFKNDEKTKEEFFSAKGVWWFKTGDIGEVHHDGGLKIIDRKKDLVKLQAGEYVSLGKVEALLATCSLVDNICVYANSTKMYCIALIIPNQAHLQKLATQKLNITKHFEELCDDVSVNKAFHQELLDHSKKVNLQKTEIPEKIKLVKEVWMPDTGLVTATFKLKRKEIERFYKDDIEKMYA